MTFSIKSILSYWYKVLIVFAILAFISGFMIVLRQKNSNADYLGEYIMLSNNLNRQVVLFRQMNEKTQSCYQQPTKQLFDQCTLEYNEIVTKLNPVIDEGTAIVKRIDVIQQRSR